MLNTNANISRFFQEDNAKNARYLKEKTNEDGVTTVISEIPRRIVTTSNMKRKPAPRLPREWPGVNRVEPRKLEKRSFHASELEDLRKRNKALAKNASAMLQTAPVPAPAKPKRTYTRKPSGKAKKG